MSKRWTKAVIFQWRLDIEESDSLDSINTLSFLVEIFVGSEGISLLFWILGGVGEISIHLEVFLGVPAGLLVYNILVCSS